MSGHRILIVDDNLELAENVAEILEDAGFASDVFEKPKEALAALVVGRYAAALLDIRMPEMNGVELYRAIKEKDPCLPAIAMTAWAGNDHIRDAVAEGVIAILPKPLDVPRLLGRLGCVIEGEKALVVEDDHHLAQNLVEVLIERGFAARAAHSCAEARKLAAAGPLSVLLVDYKLPDGDGLELVEEFCRGSDCTAVVFSGAVPALPIPNLPCGSDVKFFAKPLDFTRLVAALGTPQK